MVLQELLRHILQAARLDAEDPGSDAIAAAFLHRAAQLRETLVRFGRRRVERGLGDVAEFDGEPESVDAFVGETVQVGIGIVVDVVHQFVAVEGRTLDRAEEAARDAIAHPGLAGGCTERERRRFRAEQPIFEEVDGAAQAIVVAGDERDTFRCDFETIGFLVAAVASDEPQDRFAARELYIGQKCIQIRSCGLQVALDAVFVDDLQALGEVELVGVGCARPVADVRIALSEFFHEPPFLARGRRRRFGGEYGGKNRYRRQRGKTQSASFQRPSCFCQFHLHGSYRLC